MGKIGLVLSGGGARGAYEAGVLHYLRSGLPEKFRSLTIPILSGTSVGAINTAAMAAFADQPSAQSRVLKELWLSMAQEKIYQRNFTALLSFLKSTLQGTISNLLSFNPKKSNNKHIHWGSLLDTAPLEKFLRNALPWKNIAKNILQGPLDAVALSTTNLTTGNVEIFLHRKKKHRYQKIFPTIEGPIGVKHAMASSAIPIIFPSIKIGKYYYADGGIRLFTPTAPAIHLGADKLIIIGLRHRILPQELQTRGKVPRIRKPRVSDQLGRIFNGVFLDHMHYDVEQLNRVNALLELGKEEYGEDFLKRINSRLHQTHQKLNIPNRDFREIRTVVIYPSEVISNLYNRWLQGIDPKGFKFSAFEKLLIQVLDVSPAHGSDLLSYLTFEPGYLKALFEMGYQDALAQKFQFLELFED